MSRWRTHGNRRRARELKQGGTSHPGPLVPVLEISWLEPPSLPDDFASFKRRMDESLFRTMYQQQWPAELVERTPVTRTLRPRPLGQDGEGPAYPGGFVQGVLDEVRRRNGW